MYCFMYVGLVAEKMIITVILSKVCTKTNASTMDSIHAKTWKHISTDQSNTGSDTGNPSFSTGNAAPILVDSYYSSSSYTIIYTIKH